MKKVKWCRFGVVLISLLCSMVLLNACDTNSSTKRSISFTGDNAAPGENSLFLVQGETTEDTIEIILMATNIIIDRAYGVAFDLDFDPTVLQYLSMKKGSYFENNERFTAHYLVALQSNDNSKLVVGVTQQGKTYGVTGQGILIKFKFKGLKKGNSILRFSNNVLKNRDMETVSGISWFGGTIRVER